MFAEKTVENTEISERKKPTPVRDWLGRHLPFLLRWDSLLYYGIFLFFLGMLWAGFPFFTNDGTQLLNWDYTWQYIPFAYTYWDAWHTFFVTGHFPLYDASTFLGTDMVGSGSYYGLMDPFMFICYLAPRAWIPQMYALMTFAKLTFAGLMMRGYLKYMGIREWTARLGGLIYAFSGFTTFFEGFPTYLTPIGMLPLILWGIEKTIREQKPTFLILGVAGIGVSCFFFVPVLCIFGVIYAVWRFFLTIKTRDGKTNVKVMILGVAGFAMGLMFSAFSLIPSVRESLLSGRSASIGAAYFKSIREAIKAIDVRRLFTLVFEEVGDNPGRELMGLISFFFPTGGWTQLPLARSNGYDAWTSSLFCYTPCVILFFAALMNSIRLQKWNHLAAVLLGVFAVFTNFCYFFFYAFTGNGYGRWFIVLVPLIVYYCCWAFDLRKEEPKFIPFASTSIALGMTIFTFYFIEATLAGKEFTRATYNVNGTTYWQTTYHTASEVYNHVTTAWYFYYQLVFVVMEGLLLCIGHRKKWTKFALFGLVAVESVVMGNLSYVFNGVWSYQYSFMGGQGTLQTSQRIADNIKSGDHSFYRVHMDSTRGDNYGHNVLGLNGAAQFHSLMNFDVEDFALMHHIKHVGDTGTTYDEEQFYNPSWSGLYKHKRYATDTVLGMRYYVVENNYFNWKNPDGSSVFLPANVPFGCEELTEATTNRDYYRVYRRSEDSLPQLGFAIPSHSEHIYRIGHKEGSNYASSFFGNHGDTASFDQLQFTQYTELHGAIVEDDATLPESIQIQAQTPYVTGDSLLYANTGIKRLYDGNGLKAEYYETRSSYIPEGSTTEKPWYDQIFGDTRADYYSEGLGYFLNHHVLGPVEKTGNFLMKLDYGKLCFRSSTGTYLNEDPRGCYLEMRFYAPTSYNNRNVGAPRVYVIGDRVDDDGHVVEENVALSFDHHLLQNAARADKYNWGSCTYGLYADGLVKYVVLCYGSSQAEAASVNTRNMYLTVTERSKIEQEERQRKSDSLQNVETGVNLFRFQTAYDQERIVLTQLGFDKGWKATAKMPDGKTKDCTMLKLSGGLVGFIAPASLDENGKAQTISYELRYVTPLGLAGVGLWTLGVVLYVGYASLGFALAIRKKKNATEIDPSRA